MTALVNELMNRGRGISSLKAIANATLILFAISWKVMDGSFLNFG